MRRQLKKLVQSLSHHGHNGLPLSHFHDLSEAVRTALLEHPDVESEEGRVRVRQKARELVNREHCLRIYHSEEETNQLLLEIFKFIVRVGRKGCTYSQILKAVPKEISQARTLNQMDISHYCRKLAVEGFVQVLSGRNCRVVVWSRWSQRAGEHEVGDQIQMQAKIYYQQESFQLQEFSLVQNLHLNCKSLEAHRENGIKKQTLFLRLNKLSEKKMVSRVIEKTSDLVSHSERLGKVFMFKYLLPNQRVQGFLAGGEKIQREQLSIPQPCLLHLVDYVLSHYELYQEYIETNFCKDSLQDLQSGVLSDSLTKSLLALVCEEVQYRIIKNTQKIITKRQGTPSKLRRYALIIKIVHEHGSILQSQLRAKVAQEQKNLSMGLIHKRTMMFILNTLQVTRLLTVETLDSRLYVVAVGKNLIPIQSKQEVIEPPKTKRVRSQVQEKQKLVRVMSGQGSVKGPIHVRSQFWAATKIMTLLEQVRQRCQKLMSGECFEGIKDFSKFMGLLGEGNCEKTKANDLIAQLQQIQTMFNFPVENVKLQNQFMIRPEVLKKIMEHDTLIKNHFRTHPMRKIEKLRHSMGELTRPVLGLWWRSGRVQILDKGLERVEWEQVQRAVHYRVKDSVFLV